MAPHNRIFLIAIPLSIALALFIYTSSPSHAPETEVLFGSITSPTYLGGADATGQTNTGGGATAFGSGAGDVAIAVEGDYAFVMMLASSTACSSTASNAGNGCEFKVFDITDPANPTYIGGGDASGSTNSGTGTISGRSVIISGDYAYTTWNADGTTCSATAGSAVGCELKIWDISTPSTPTYIGGGDASGSTNSGTATANFVGIAITASNIAVLSSGNGTTCSATAGSAVGCELKIWDISTPSTPTYIGGGDASGSTNSGTGNSSAQGIHISGNYAYTSWANGVTLCSATAGSAVGCELKIWDISTPSTPTYSTGIDASANIATGTSAVTANALVASGNYLFTTWDNNNTTCSNSSGAGIGCEVKMFDISTPSAPSYVAGADSTGAVGSGAGNVGARGIAVSSAHLFTTWVANGGTCSATAGSAVGCEFKVWDISTPSTPTYLSGGDASGTANSGTGGQNSTGIVLSGDYAFTTWNTNGGTCSATAGSAVGCELKIWEISIPLSLIINKQNEYFFE